MTDERLRELAREAALGGADAQARLLRERLRSGDLAEEQAYLLANLGHAPAVAALGDPAPIADISAWIVAMPRPELLHASAGIVRAQLERHERRPALLHAGRQALDAVCSWSAGPDADAADACQGAAQVAFTALTSVRPSPGGREILARADATTLEGASPAMRALLTCVLLADAPVRAGSDSHFALQVRRAFDVGQPLLGGGRSFREALCVELLPGALEACGA